MDATRQTLLKSKRPHSFLVLVLLSLTVAALVIPVASAYAQLEDVIARVKRATVLVEVRNALGLKGHGSGFIYDASGFVLTNHHVIEGAVDITVKLSDGRSFPATVVDYVRREEYTDAELRSDTDVAILKIPATGLAVLFPGDSTTLRQGEEIVILGYPGGVGTEEVTATRGIVSAIRSGWFQTDASIEPGDSGGPVVDSQGRVMGIATFITGPLRRIGGVVAINGIRDLAISALNPNVQPHKEFSIPGLEYVSPLVTPKKKTWRISYDPGKSRQQSYIREYTNEITDVQNINGALVFNLHDSRGGDAKYYLDSEGVFITNYWESSWSYSYPRPLLGFPLPPAAGRSWDGEYGSDNAQQGIRGQSTLDYRIDTVDEVITVPAGTFSRTIKVLIREQQLRVRGSQRAFISCFECLLVCSPSFSRENGYGRRGIRRAHCSGANWGAMSSYAISQSSHIFEPNSGKTFGDPPTTCKDQIGARISIRITLSSRIVKIMPLRRYTNWVVPNPARS